jgi:hypothetical protein
MSDKKPMWYLTTNKDQYPCPTVQDVASTAVDIQWRANHTKAAGAHTTTAPYALWEWDGHQYKRLLSCNTDRALDPNIQRFKVYLTVDAYPPGAPSAKMRERYNDLCMRPPYGMTATLRDGVPVLTGWIAAASQWAAIAMVVKKAADQHQVTLTSCGIENPDEWLGGDHDQTTAAHLLLQAVHRAHHSGIAVTQLKEMLRVLEA